MTGARSPAIASAASTRSPSRPVHESEPRAVRSASSTADARGRGSVAVALGAILLVTAGHDAQRRPACGGARQKDSVPPRYGGSSTRNEPGQVPYPTDSASGGGGRRTDAPIVNEPFRGGTKRHGRDGTGGVPALHHHSADSLLVLCVRDTEFRDILWPESPRVVRPSASNGRTPGACSTARLHARLGRRDGRFRWSLLRVLALGSTCPIPTRWCITRTSKLHNHDGPGGA